MTPLLGAGLLAGLLFTATVAQAHEGHDHGAPPPPVSSTIAPRADASSGDFEIVAIARGDQLRVYVDRFRGNEPVTGAALEIDTASGLLTPTADGEGAYVVSAPWLSAPGRYDLAITVQVDGLVDILTATLTIPEPPPPPAAPVSLVGELVGSAVARDIRSRIETRDTSLWLVAGGGFLAGLLTMALWRRRAVAIAATAVALFATGPMPGAEAASPQTGSATTVPVVARDVSQRFPDGALFVPKPTQRILAIRTLFTEVRTFPGAVELPARVIPDPAGAGLVQASVAGRLTPPPEGFPRLGTRVAAGDVLALVQTSIGAADVTTQQQQSRELDQQIAITERRLERFRQIQGVVARAQIEDAELELAGLKTRRANLERAPREPERLVAPVSGVIAAVQATAGQIAEPNAVIFQIIDPNRYWVEAASFESHPIDEVAAARLADGRTLALRYRGSGLADRNQAIPIHFAVEGDTRGLRAGQFLTVLARTRDERSGIAVPRTSILRGANGQTIVYEHTNAERFVPREVRVEALDGERVLIVSGVEAGRRIVTQGAELLNQIR